MVENETNVRKQGNWLLWWQISDEELNYQVDNYDTLKFNQSARGLSLIFIGISALMTVLLITLGGFPAAALIDIIIMLILGAFVYNGKKWAMITMMLYICIGYTMILYPLYICIYMRGTHLHQQLMVSWRVDNDYLNK